MAAVVAGIGEALALLTNLAQAAATVSAAVQTAQSSGQPVDWTSILGEESTAESAVLAAIAAAKAAGK